MLKQQSKSTSQALGPDTKFSDLKQRQAALDEHLARRSEAAAEPANGKKRKKLADELEQEAAPKAWVKKSKKRKASRGAAKDTSKDNAGDAQKVVDGEAPQEGTVDRWPNSQPKSLKKRKRKSKATTYDTPQNFMPATESNAPAADQDDGTFEQTATTNSKPDDGPKKQKPDRFIAFIGNLPFDTTLSSLQKHFHAIKPDSIRLLTKKAPVNDLAAARYKDSSGHSSGRNSSGKESNAPKSKGYAFLEFSSYHRLRTCLKLYHHSYFCADESGAGKGSTRRINVELTAGGGGKSEGRKEKLKVKNERLGKQRERRLKVEKGKREERKAAKERGDATGVNAIAKAEKETEEKADGEGRKEKPTAGGAGNVHPERMQMLRQGGMRRDRGARVGAWGRGRGRGGGRGGARGT